MDAIFKALDDPTRRALLDRLREKDGQTLTELEERLVLSRFGVMKHLKVLEAAGLVVSIKRGRSRYHYLNAVPLQQILDRWIEPLVARPLARGLIALKSHLEGETAMLDAHPKPDFVHQTFIRTPQERLWDALTLADQVAQYHFACSVVSGDAAAVGAPMRMIRADGSTMLTQRVTLLDPKSRIEMTFEPDFGEDRTVSRIVFLIESMDPMCKLTCEHYDIPPAQGGVREGWAMQIASLKSWLETGEPLKMPG